MPHPRPRTSAPRNHPVPRYAAAQGDEGRRRPGARLQPAPRPPAELHRQRAGNHLDSPARPHPPHDRRLRPRDPCPGRPRRLLPPERRRRWNDQSRCPIPSTDHRNASRRQPDRSAGPCDPLQDRDAPRRSPHLRGTSARCRQCAEPASCPTTIVENRRRGPPTNRRLYPPTNHQTRHLGPAHRGTLHVPARCRHGRRCSSGPTSTIQRDIIPSRSAPDTRRVGSSPDAEQRHLEPSPDHRTTLTDGDIDTDPGPRGATLAGPVRSRRRTEGMSLDLRLGGGSVGVGECRKAHPVAGGPFWNGVRRRPTLPHPGGCSTIGAEGLSFRVRNGTGRFPFAMAAVTVSSCQTGSRSLLGNRTVDACMMLW